MEILITEESKHSPKTVSDALQITQVALDSYDDIFSDFDPSPYETRLLSDDFITELRRHYAENRKGEFIIHFTIPKTLRSEKTESLVKRRIKDHFRTRLKELEKESGDRMKKGIIRVSIGIFFLFLTLFIPSLDIHPYVEIMSVFSWYFIWAGLELIFESSSRLRRKIVFSEKFLRAEYKFIDQEEVVRMVSNLSKTVEKNDLLLE